MKSPGYERVIVWIVLAALGLFTMVCIFWTPYDQSKLLRPIPANVVLISSHHNLGSRLESLATNVFFKALFSTNNPASAELFRNNRYAARILASHSIIAYVPDFNQSSNPALAVSSWVGGWTPVLRWALLIHPPRDIVPLGEYNGHRLWAYKKPVSCFGAVNFLSFAIDEGVFIGCLSQDRNGVVYLLRNYDGRKDSVLSIPPCNATLPAVATRQRCGRVRSIAGRPQSRLIESSSAADQVWLRVDLPHIAQNKSMFAVCSLDVLENDYLAASIRFEPDPGFARFAARRARVSICANDRLRQNQDMVEIGKMSACSASSIALFPSDLVADGLNGLISPAWARTIKPILAPAPGTNNVCLLMVLTGNYGGQFGKEPFRIAVPTVLLAVSGSRQGQAKAAVLELLDLINVRHRLGLILNSALSPAGQCPIFTIESTSGALLKSLPVEDQPSFVFYNNWFLLASNSAGLRRLLLNFQSQDVSADGGSNNLKYMNFNVVGSPLVGDRSESGRAQARPLHLLKQPDSFQKKAFIWIDPDAGGKALRLALMAAIIMLEREGKYRPEQNTIRILRAARAWLEDISNLKSCAAWMESENGKTVVRLEIGRRKTDEEIRSQESEFSRKK